MSDIDIKLLKKANNIFTKKYIKSKSLFKELVLNSNINIKKESEYKLLLIKLYEEITKGNIEFIKNIKLNYDIINNKDINLLHYCLEIGDINILKILLKKGGNINSIKNNKTLLEYACYKNDPNIINFLINYGADIHKHLYLRKDTTKMKISYEDIDMLILTKLILYNSLQYEKTNNNYKNNFNFLKKYIDCKLQIGINKFNLNEIIKGLNFLFLDKNSYFSYKHILEEELSYSLKLSILCPKRKLDILLINLIPFINYPFNLATPYFLKNELLHIINKLKGKEHFKNVLFQKINKTYVINNLFTLDHLGIYIYELILKNI